MRKRALIFGAGGQDGSYLAELLLDKGYEVHGTYRRSSVDNLVRVAGIKNRLLLYEADLADPLSVQFALNLAYQGDGPLEVYNMADQDNVASSTITPGYSVQVTAGGPAAILEAILQKEELRHSIRFFQPISSTIFGSCPAQTPQMPDTPLAPDSPYACAKAHAWHLCRYYRRKGLWVACGIMYNHDSPRRGPHYLLQKIARGQQLAGNLQTLVDIGWAPNFMQAVHAMMQLDHPTDLCIGTGRPYRIKDLLDVAEGAIVPYRDYLRGAEEAVTPDVRWTRNAIGWEAVYDARDVLIMLQNEYTRSTCASVR